MKILKSNKGVVIGFCFGCVFAILTYLTNETNYIPFDYNLWHITMFIGGGATALVLMLEDVLNIANAVAVNAFYVLIVLLYFSIIGNILFLFRKRYYSMVLIFVVLLLLHTASYFYVKSTFHSFEEGVSTAFSMKNKKCLNRAVGSKNPINKSK